MRSSLWASAVLAVACTVSAQEAKPKTDQATVADVRRLLEVTGAARMGLQVIASLGASMKQANPEVPEAIWNELLAEFRADEMTDIVVPIYTKYLTGEDVRGLLAFYEGPLGQKLLAAQPQIIQDAMAAGQQWGAECARRVLKRLQERGYAGKATAD